MKYAAAAVALGLALHATPATSQEVISYGTPEVTTYYAPSVPVTTYYAPAPVTTYYAPAPVTTYYAPATAYFAPAVSYPATYYYVPPRVARRLYRGAYYPW